MTACMAVPCSCHLSDNDNVRLHVRSVLCLAGRSVGRGPLPCSSLVVPTMLRLRLLQQCLLLCLLLVRKSIFPKVGIGAGPRSPGTQDNCRPRSCAAHAPCAQHTCGTSSHVSSPLSSAQLFFVPTLSSRYRFFIVPVIFKIIPHRARETPLSGVNA
jgi:hypothetical protein